MASRPRLKPYFRPLRRGPDSVQLGVSGESGGVVITGLTPADIALLDRLDGSSTERDLYAVAAGCGVARRRADELLTLLLEHHLLATERLDRADLGQLGPSVIDVLRDDAETLGILRDVPRDPFAHILERARRHVLVSGSGHLPWSIAALLRTGGVGRVDIGSWAVDAVDHEVCGTRDAGPYPTSSSSSARARSIPPTVTRGDVATSRSCRLSATGNALLSGRSSVQPPTCRVCAASRCRGPTETPPGRR